MARAAWRRIDSPAAPKETASCENEWPVPAAKSGHQLNAQALALAAAAPGAFGGRIIVWAAYSYEWRRRPYSRAR